MPEPRLIEIENGFLSSRVSCDANVMRFGRVSRCRGAILRDGCRVYLQIPLNSLFA